MLVPGTHASHLRDYEYKRLGTVWLLAGLDLHTGRVTEIVNNTHKSSATLTESLTKLDVAYPATSDAAPDSDNHSAHISRETSTISGDSATTVSLRSQARPLAESVKMTRTMLRQIRVATKQELTDRIHLYFRECPLLPVVFRWKYKMAEIDLTS